MIRGANPNIKIYYNNNLNKNTTTSLEISLLCLKLKSYYYMKKIKKNKFLLLY